MSSAAAAVRPPVPRDQPARGERPADEAEHDLPGLHRLAVAPDHRHERPELRGGDDDPERHPERGRAIGLAEPVEHARAATIHRARLEDAERLPSTPRGSSIAPRSGMPMRPGRVRSTLSARSGPCRISAPRPRVTGGGSIFARMLPRPGALRQPARRVRRPGAGAARRARPRARGARRQRARAAHRGERLDGVAAARDARGGRDGRARRRAGPYRLGLGLVALADGVLARLDVRELARPRLRALVAATGETATLSVPGAGRRGDRRLRRGRVERRQRRAARAAEHRRTRPRSGRSCSRSAGPARSPRPARSSRAVHRPHDRRPRARSRPRSSAVRARGWAEAAGEREPDLNALGRPRLRPRRRARRRSRAPGPGGAADGGAAGRGAPRAAGRRGGACSGRWAAEPAASAPGVRAVARPGAGRRSRSARSGTGAAASSARRRARAAISRPTAIIL